MQRNECFVCGCNDFTVTDGAFVCNECGIQSQVRLYNLLIFHSKENVNTILNYRKVIVHLKLFIYFSSQNYFLLKFI